ncbi:hypothetical protein G6N76_19085 [Rhizobium daejeonense]|uniref:Uncharacterized protein n=1 Tax=Rhizobium daejeonense TaxID=240521 RepID=A0A6M1S635_9HYPH|nr:hypothetical protein [Rhizobium daejeonense]NGO65781.1 hypothetical protein [Rhizobium daejeonense]
MDEPAGCIDRHHRLSDLIERIRNGRQCDAPGKMRKTAHLVQPQGKLSEDRPFRLFECPLAKRSMQRQGPEVRAGMDSDARPPFPVKTRQEFVEKWRVLIGGIDQITIQGNLASQIQNPCAPVTIGVSLRPSLADIGLQALSKMRGRHRSFGPGLRDQGSSHGAGGRRDLLQEFCPTRRIGNNVRQVRGRMLKAADVDRHIAPLK